MSGEATKLIGHSEAGRRLEPGTGLEGPGNRFQVRPFGRPGMTKRLRTGASDDDGCAGGRFGITTGVLADAPE
jgi:hypothetical protein